MRPACRHGHKYILRGEVGKLRGYTAVQAASIEKVDAVFGKVSSVGHYLELLVRQRMIWMSYLETEELNAVMRRIP